MVTNVIGILWAGKKIELENSAGTYCVNTLNSIELYIHFQIVNFMVLHIKRAACKILNHS